MTTSPKNGAVTANFDHMIAMLSLGGIAAYLILRYLTNQGDNSFDLALSISIRINEASRYYGQFNPSLPILQIPLLMVLILGGIPQIVQLVAKVLRGDFGADLLAGISIVTAILLNQWLAGCLVVLMLSGGAVLESYALRKASSVLDALAKRMPFIAHKKTNELLEDVRIDQIRKGDVLVVLPHEVCPVDGTVLEGNGSMDESYLTGEPYLMAKTSGSPVLSGAVNGDTALSVRADKLAVDSRYAKIMAVMQSSEQNRPKIRRLGDQLGALYTPVAVAVALTAWVLSGDILRFLSVLVVATPCPLLIAIPVTIISSISLAARREIIIKNPAVLENLNLCRTAIFDKTGTLTYGRPTLSTLATSPGHDEKDVLTLVASLESYAKHPLSGAIIKAAKQASLPSLPVSGLSETAGEGLKGMVSGKEIQITSRQKCLETFPHLEHELPPISGGLECIALIDRQYAATLQFRDEIRLESPSFIGHLQPNHLFERVMLVSGDRESEVNHLAKQVGINHVFFGQSPEQKLELVHKETASAKTVFLGDGINDAPAMTAATIGIAFGQNSDITSEAADAVIMNSSLIKVDELLHIGERMRSIALQSAVGGMVLSVIGMIAAGSGHLTPVAGAIVQEAIDVLAVLNALRAAMPPKALSDF